MERKVKIHGVYKHFKGDYYLVEDVATHSETREIYRYILFIDVYMEKEIYI